MDFGIKENADVSLHDCRTDRIDCDEQSIRFYIPNGFYMIPVKNDSDKTENYNAKVTCHFVDKYEDRFCVTLYRKNIFGQTVRKDITDSFVNTINSGRAEFEFVYTYKSYHGVIFKGYIWKRKRPWYQECEIELMTDEMIYSWDERQTGALNELTIFAKAPKAVEKMG